MKMWEKWEKPFLRTSGAVLLLGMLGSGPRPAEAAQLEVNTSSPHLCAVVEGGKTANGTPVIAYSCSGGPADQWNMVNSQLQGIGTANGKSMCLNVSGTTTGSPVNLYACNGGKNQQWVFSFGRIFGVQSALCLDSSGGPASGGGTQLVVNECSDATSQNWILRAVQLQLNSSAPYMCVAVSGGDTAPGTPVLSYSCGDSPQQVWNFTGSKETNQLGQFQGIGTENGESTCLTLSGMTAGSLVNLSPCTTSSEATWTIINGTGFGLPASNLILSAVAELCLDSSGGPAVGGGRQLVANNCDGKASQNWDIR